MVFPTAEQRLEQREGNELKKASAAPFKATIPKPPVDTRKCHRTQLLNKLGIVDASQMIISSSSESGNVQNNNNRQPHRSLIGNVQITTEPLKYDDNFHKTLQEKYNRAMKRSTSAESLFSAFSSIFIGSSPPKEEAKAEAVEESKQQQQDDDSVDSSSCQPSKTETDNCSSANSSVCSSNTNTNNSKRSRGITFNDEVTVVPIPERSEYSKRIRERIWVDARELQSLVARNTVEFAAEGWDWKNALEDEEMYVCAVSGEKVHPVHCETDD
jgi:hypothetical protein